MWPRNEVLQPPENLTFRLERLSAESEQRRLLREAGIVPRPWLSCQICLALWRLGRAMIRTGNRLEQRYAGLQLGRA
jgi:hypothetical protein